MKHMKWFLLDNNNFNLTMQNFSTKDDETTVDVGDSENRLTLSGSLDEVCSCSFLRFFWLQQLQKARRLYTHSSSVASSKSTVNSIKILLTFYNLCIRLDYWKKTQRTLRQRSPVHLRTFCQQWRGLLNLLPLNPLTILAKSLSSQTLVARLGRSSQ